MELEDFYKRNLKIYLKDGKSDSAKGVSHIQRICRVGYNQACCTQQYGVEQGILERDNKKDWLHRIAKQTRTGAG